jgi:hypothetical protein
MTSTVVLKLEKRVESLHILPEEYILKEVAAKIEYVKPAFLFWPNPGTFR